MDEMIQKIDELAVMMAKGFEQMTTKTDLDRFATKEDLQRVGAKVDGLEMKVDRLDTRVGHLEIKVDNLQEDVTSIRETLDGFVARDIKDLKKRVTTLEHLPKAV